MRYWIWIPIVTLLAACGNNENGADAYGNFEATELLVSSSAMGRIMQLQVTEGQQLKGGEYVGYVDTAIPHLQKAQLIASMDALKSKIAPITAQIQVLEEQKKNLVREQKRLQNLVAKDAATQKQLDDMNGQINVVDQQIASTRSQNGPILAQLASLQKQIAQVNVQIQHALIRSPIHGTVLTKFAEEGEIVAFGKPLFKIADLKNMDLRVYVTEAQLVDLKLGQEVEVHYASNGQTLPGKIEWISSEAEFTPKTIQTREERTNLVYAIKIKVANNGQLKIGMPADVTFTAKSEG